MATHRAYIICTSPRSGSTLLCSLLAATGVAGDPDSHFHKPALADWVRDYGLTPPANATRQEVLRKVFQAARKRGTGDTGLFGLRLQRASFDYLMAQMAILYPKADSDLGRIRAAFGDTRFIHLTRTDKLAQAVSYVRATQSGLCHIAPDGTELERLSQPQPATYDPDAIAHALSELSARDAEWQVWFRQQGITPLRLTYEHLARYPGGILAAVLDALGLDPTLAKGIAPGVARLSDATNRDWIGRFRTQRGGD